MLALNRSIVFVALCLLGSITAPAEQTAEPMSQAIGLVFQGNETFSDTQLRDGLDRDPAFLISNQSLGDHNSITAVTANRLVAGYRNHGFRNVTVQAAHDVDTSLWTFTITEGKRFTCGGVQVNGDLPIPVEDLVARLTRPFPADDTFPSFVEVNAQTLTRWVDESGKEKDLQKPVWKIGEPVPFESDQKLQAACHRAMASLGFSSSLIFVSINSDLVTQTGRLVIDIADAGKPNQANSIVIEGNEINSRESILDFVNIHEADAVDQKAIQSITRKLWESGRFTTHRVKFDRVQNGTLTIIVDEIEGCPSLDTPLDQRAKAFLRAGNWVARKLADGGELELILAAKSYSIRMIQSNRGLYLEWKQPVASESEQEAERFRLLVDSETVLVDQTSHSKQLRFSPISVGQLMKYSLKVGAAPKSSEHGRLNFNWELTNNRRSEDESPLQYVSSYGPADWLPFAYKTQSRFEIADRHLIAKTDDTTMEIDIDSGELVRWTSANGTHQFVSGAFDTMRQELFRDTAGKPNAFDQSQPVTSVSSYLLSEPIMDPLINVSKMQSEPGKSVDPLLISGLRKMVDGGLLSLADAFVLVEKKQSSDDKFEIPVAEIVPQGWTQMLVELAAQAMLKYSPDLFAEETWPLRLSRQAAFVVMGANEHTRQVLDQILRDPNHGPLCHACVASLIGWVDQDAAKLFARRAIDTMSPEAFERDYGTLTAAVSGTIPTRTLTCLHALSQSEVDSIKKTMKNESSRACVQMLYEYSQNQPENEGRFWYQIAEKPLREAMQRTLSQ